MQTDRERRLTIDSQSGAVGGTSSPSPEEAPLESAPPSSSATTATNYPLLSLFPTFFCLALILPGQSSTPLKIPTTAAQPPKVDTLGIRRCNVYLLHLHHPSPPAHCPVTAPLKSSEVLQQEEAADIIPAHAPTAAIAKK